MSIRKTWKMATVGFFLRMCLYLLFEDGQWLNVLGWSTCPQPNRLQQDKPYIHLLFMFFFLVVTIWLLGVFEKAWVIQFVESIMGVRCWRLLCYLRCLTHHLSGSTKRFWPSCFHLGSNFFFFFPLFCLLLFPRSSIVFQLFWFTVFAWQWVFTILFRATLLPFAIIAIEYTFC